MRKITLTLLCLILISGCSLNVTRHNEDQAIDPTNNFLSYLIKENYNTAYDNCISNDLKENLSYERFENDLKESREVRGPIKKAVFNSYMLVPNEKAMQLFYDVEHEQAGTVIYHFVVEGDKYTGYKIIVVDIGNKMEYPPDMKYLGLKKIKKDKPVIIPGDD